MFTRGLLCGVFYSLLSAPLSAQPIVISEGPLPSYIQEPTIVVSGEFAPGFTRVSAELGVYGGNFALPKPWGSFDFLRETAPTITINARYARSQILNEKLDVRVEGWLDDGNFFRFTSRNEFDAPGWTLLSITPTDDPLPFLHDADGDQDLDIEDLNAVRNNFGGRGDGDIDKSGTVDIADLNWVRNGFGQDQFELDESHVASVGLSHAGLPTQAVPEPASVVLLLIGLTVLCSRCRLR